MIVECAELGNNTLYENTKQACISFLSRFHFEQVRYNGMVECVDNYRLLRYDYLIDQYDQSLAPPNVLPFSKIKILLLLHHKSHGDAVSTQRLNVYIMY